MTHGCALDEAGSARLSQGDGGQAKRRRRGVTAGERERQKSEREEHSLKGTRRRESAGREGKWDTKRGDALRKYEMET